MNAWLRADKEGNVRLESGGLGAEDPGTAGAEVNKAGAENPGTAGAEVNKAGAEDPGTAGAEVNEAGAEGPELGRLGNAKQPKSPGADSFTRESFQQLFIQVSQYDLKETVLRFCGRVDWALAENDEALQNRLVSLRGRFLKEFENILSYRKPVENLDIYLRDILDLCGTDSGYISTPAEIGNLIGDMLEGSRPVRIADFCCGCAGLGIGLWRRMAEGNSDALFYGAERDPILCDIGTMMLFFHGVEGRIERADLLSIPPGQPDSFDFIVMDIPQRK